MIICKGFIHVPVQYRVQKSRSSNASKYISKLMVEQTMDTQFLSRIQLSGQKKKGERERKGKEKENYSVLSIQK